MPEPIKLFYAYAREDEKLRKQLETHLAALMQQGLIRGWHDRQIGAGAEWKAEISKHLEQADVILLLISAHFIASEYCSDVEMKRALERHEARDACVIPIILRACYWKDTPFAKLQALPRDAKPVTNWKNRDKAWSSVAHGKSMAAIAEASFQDEITAFFRTAAEELRACGLLDEFLTLART